VQWLWIAVFGACGCLLRYTVSGWVQQTAARQFPWGTLAVNIGGSFLLAFVVTWSLRSTALPAAMRIGITVGFMGGFTTFSTFSLETFRMLEDGRILQAGGNVLFNVVLCLAAVFMGILVARQILQ